MQRIYSLHFGACDMRGWSLDIFSWQENPASEDESGKPDDKPGKEAVGRVLAES